MKAEVERCAVSYASDVWLYTRDTDGITIYNLDGSVRERLPAGAKKPEPSFTFGDEVLRVLIAEASDVLPPDRAQAEHLKDTISVRDRLLSLVEKQWDD